MKEGIDLIAAERRRQIDAEGWTSEHDDTHDDNELAQAAQCYIWAARQLSIQHPNERMPIDCVLPLGAMSHETMVTCGADKGSRDWRVPQWPWSPAWWKPGTDPVRCLAKAGALIAADIDRLQRRTP